MAVSDCDEAPFCPALPYCVSAQRSREDMDLCPSGEPYMNPSSNQTVECNPRSRALSCPEGFSCYSSNDSAEGTCCPVQHKLKSGQCPFLVPVSVDSCDNECATDDDCDSSLKCCSNGCGTQCVEPLIKTACQHTQVSILFKFKFNFIINIIF